MKKLIIFFLIFGSCQKETFEYNELNGTYQFEDISLNFDNGIILGFSECNSIKGNYILENDSISIILGGTKIGCNEFNFRKYLTGTFYIDLENDYFIIEGSDYQILFKKID